MEIDFLGLNTPKYKLEQQHLENPFADSGGGVEISLSLSTSSSSPLDFSDLQKKKWEFAAREKIMTAPSCSGSTLRSLAPHNHHSQQQPPPLLVARPLFRHPGGGGFVYDHSLRTMSQLSAQKKLYIHNHGNAIKGLSAGVNVEGHTPTVAMARRATLARFLEKRLHRMNQARASHLMGKSSEAQITRNNVYKKSNDDLRRR